jgi:hypothetical protein
MAKAVILNVGGKFFSTTASTLQSPLAKGSMLEALFALHVQERASASAGSGMQATCTDPTHPGALFIDRDGENFTQLPQVMLLLVVGAIWSLLASWCIVVIGNCHCCCCRDGCEMVMPADLHTTQLVWREALFYQLTGLVELLERQVWQLNSGKVAVSVAALLSMYGRHSHWSTLLLTAAAHEPPHDLMHCMLSLLCPGQVIELQDIKSQVNCKLHRSRTTRSMCMHSGPLPQFTFVLFGAKTGGSHPARAAAFH